MMLDGMRNKLNAIFFFFCVGILADDLWMLFFLTRFNPVVGGGPNAAVIHYSRNDQKVKLH